MVARLASLRLWLLAAMIVSAGAGLVAAGVLFDRVQNSHEHADDASKARAEAQVIAARAQAGAPAEALGALQSMLLNDQVVVVRDGATVYEGPSLSTRRFELRVTVPYPRGTVSIADYSSAGSGVTLELVLITAGLLALVIAAAVTTATVVTRAVRVPVGRAIEAADKVSHGELSARMGETGPEELVKLGRAFDDMAARLERADRDQRQFLADIAHEIATPVNAVSGFAIALADGAVGDDVQREEARAVIETETARLRDLLTDVRQLTHLDLAEGRQPGPVDLRELTEQLAARFRPAAAAAGLTLEVLAPSATVTTDGRLVDLVASNLVTNAIRYTPSGGRIDVRATPARGGFVLGVRDTGVGIAPEHQRRIFERLYRVDATRDRATGGSGLGLAIAGRAAANLGGHIELDSEPGRGSEFRLVVASRAPEF